MKAFFECCVVLAGILFLASCNESPDIQRAYDFHLSTWHLQKSVKPDEQVEIRFHLTREGNYDKAEYFLAYVQMDGRGEVTDAGGQPLVSREYYALGSLAGLATDDPQKQVFTLFYRSQSDKKSELKFVVIDNFGQERELYVSFDADTSDK